MEQEKRKILIVDDDSFLLDMYALKFSQNNFEVYTAPDGVYTLEKMKGGLEPDILLIDIIMPEMDGFKTLEQIKEQGLCPKCLKIILSNKSDPRDMEEGKRLGVVGYIVKANYTPIEVIDQVVGILEKNNSVSK